MEGIRVTGSGSRTIAKVLGLYFENEFKAIARMIAEFYPQARTVFEIGGESSKYIRLDRQSIVDYDRSGECAAGTGSFLDQQALRMRTRWRKWAAWWRTPGCAARIAGRCSVFAKSDMIHAQQKGYSPAEILRGLCDAVARNFKSSIVKGRPVEAPVALIGAVSQNAGVTAALREAFGLAESQSVRAGALRLVRRHRRGHAGGRGAAQTLVPATSTGCASTKAKSASKIPRRSPWRTSCCCATASEPISRRPAILTTNPFRPTWASTSARYPPTWWLSTKPAR